MTLEAFLAQAAPRIGVDLRETLADLHRITSQILAHLNGHPALATQVSRLRDGLPDTLAGADQTTRADAVTEARLIAADIKQRWISEDSPPLVSEIDDRLAEIEDALQELARPGAETLRDAARQIDRLGRVGQSLEGIERRYGPFVKLGGGLFVIGIVLFFAPGLFPFLPSGNLWTVMLFLSVLPLVAIHYAYTVLPRSRADTEIDTLNRKHFLPVGGIYFPEGERPACVVLVDWPPPEDPHQEAVQERRKTREKLGPFW